MVRVSQTPYHFELKEIQFKLIFCFILIHIRLLCAGQSVTNVCNRCICDKYQINIDCTSRNLTSVPKDIPATVETLGLGSNIIINVKEGSLNQLNLQELYLHNNKITNITEGTFRNLTKLMTLGLGSNIIINVKEGSLNPLNLQELYLTNNKITNIAEGTFRHLTKLELLYLGNNRIMNISGDAFENLVNLKYLGRGSNIIINVKEGSLEHLNLQELQLYNNRITNITEGTFRNLTKLETLGRGSNIIINVKEGSLKHLNLQELYLYNNKITKIAEGTFRHLTKLESLSLRINRIMNISGDDFENLVNLKYLHLNSNTITNIAEGTFRNLTKLETLYLSYNRIMNISGDAFENLVNLKYLYLNNNKITNITEGTFRNLTKFETLDLSGNDNMICGCYLPAMVDYINKTYSRRLAVDGKCRYNQTKLINILQYSKCKNNSLFQQKLQCKTCSGIMCNDSEVTSCPGTKPVCMNRTSMSGVTLTSEKLCSTRGECVEAKRNTTFTCNKWTSGASCVDCCTGNLCNKNDLIVFCNGITTSRKGGTFRWPTTEIGRTVTISCGAKFASRHCSSKMVVQQKIPTTKCLTSKKCSPFIGVWEDPDMSQCDNTDPITAKLEKIQSQEINEQNIEDLSKQLVNISQKSVYFKEKDIDLAIDIHENMVPWISNVSANITMNSILLSINNMINTPEKILVGAEQSSRRILDVIGAISENVQLEEQQLTVLYSNLGIGITKVEKNSFNGRFYGILSKTNETEAKNMIYNSSYLDLQLEDINMMDFISLPKSSLKHLKEEKRSDISRISFISMETNKLYKVIQTSGNETNSTIEQVIISRIIAANIPNIQITNLDEPVTVSFSLLHKNATNPQCVYWDETPGQIPHWSTKGCNTSNHVPGENVVCSCNHLTSFALLMDVYQNEGDIKNVKALSIISMTGCGISLVFLILTVIIHVCLKDLWKIMASKILVNVCFSLAVTNLIFVVGMQPYATKTIAACKAVAVLLHYFLMVSLMWMTVEALQVFLAVVVVFKTYQKSFMIRSSIFAWGLPAVIVIITLAINYTNNYIQIGQVCWLSQIPFYAAFLTPVVITLIFNLTIFVVVIWRLISMQHNKKFEHKRRKVRVCGIIGLFFLFGLSWILAFFTFGEAAVVFKYLFVIFNTFQGLFIFILNCIFNKYTRKVICMCVCKYNRKKGTKNKTSPGRGNQREVRKYGSSEDKTKDTEF